MPMHEAGRSSDHSDNILPIGRSDETPSPRSFRQAALDFWRPQLLSSSKSTAQSRATAYLDGLRGLAAFIVYVAHSEAWNHDVEAIQRGFGYLGNHALITLPFLRVFFTGGHAAVAVFFVISGYVLSHRALKLIHQQSEEVYPVLSSSVFRRVIRLYFPFITTTIIIFTIWHVLRIQTEWPKPQGTYAKEVLHWWTEFSQFAYPFRTPSDDWFSYDFPLWTIPIEFQGSILVFITLLATSRISPKARTAIVTIIALYFLSVNGWQMFCFLMGLVISEQDLLMATKKLRGVNSALKKNEVAIFSTILFTGLYLASQPSMKDIAGASGTPGWSLLTHLIPQVYKESQWWRFWLAICAPLLVVSTGRVPFIRRLLEGSVPQYLGRISFALYLVHIPIATTIGDRIFRVTGYLRPLTEPSAWDSWLSIPKIGPLGMELDFLIPQLFLLPITFYIAEIACKLLDEPSVSLGNQAYIRLAEW